LRAGFPVPPPTRLANAPKPSDDRPLAVVEVGSFEASFVPAVKDFARLDERFRLPTEVWDKLPSYKDSGFAVFKLKQGAKRVHPMAFEFPRADPQKLFFPTVHIHDGKVHDKAHFDHALYCQSDSVKMMQWQESRQPVSMFMKVDNAQGLLDANKHCFRKEMRGDLKNEDILV